MNHMKTDGWVRMFEVPTRQKHEQGYTVYKVISRVFPCQYPEACTQVTVWKRFRQFRKLHKEMESLHSALYLKGTFPPLQKASYFRRFDSSVMTERQSSIRALLEFVALHPPLFTSANFVKFFEDGDCRSVSEADRLPPPPLSPHQSLTSSFTGSDVTGPPTDRDATGSLSADDVKEQLAALLDPLPPVPVTASDWPTNVQLLTEPQPDLLCQLSEVPCPTSDLPSVGSCEDGASVDLAAKLATGLGTELAADLTSDAPAADPDDLPVSRLAVVDGAEYGSTATQIAADAPHQRASPAACLRPGLDRDLHQAAPHATSQQTLSVMSRAGATQTPSETTEDSGQYLLTAADAICRAQQAESQCLWQLAFALYQEGIVALINGVQGDPSDERRQAVRRKTAMYIGRAEQLAQLCSQPTPADPTQRSGQLSNYCVEGGRRLAAFKVVGLSAGHLKVTETSSGRVFLMKVVEKCARMSDSPESSTLLPESVPHMVQLYQLVETEHAYFLVLHYAPGGTLWDALSGHDRPPLDRPSPFGRCSTVHSPDSSPGNCGRPTTRHGVSFLSGAEQAGAAGRVPTVADSVGVGSAAGASSRRQLGGDSVSQVACECPPGRGRSPVSRPASGRASSSDAASSEEWGGGGGASSSYLRLFEELAASSRGAVSLARNRSCPEPAQSARPTATGPAAATAPAAEPIEPVEADSPDGLVSRALRLLSAVDRTLALSSHRAASAGSVSTRSHSQSAAVVDSECASDGGMRTDPDVGVACYSALSTGVDSGCPAARGVSMGASDCQGDGAATHASSDVVPSLPEADGYNPVTDGDPVADGDTMSATFPNSCDHFPSFRPANEPNHVSADPTASAGLTFGGDPVSFHDSASLHGPSTYDSMYPYDSTSHDFTSTSYYTSLDPVSRDSVPHGPTCSHDTASSGDRVRPVRRRRWTSPAVSCREVGLAEPRAAAGDDPAPAPTADWEHQVRLWAAQIVTAVGRLHEHSIICRDLNPVNILITESGDVCITYFCRLRGAARRPASASAAGGPYSAPELSSPTWTATAAADWWSVGALLLELSGGRLLDEAPPAGVSGHMAPRLPPVAPAVHSLLTELLRPRPDQRPGLHQIRRHPYFSGVDWDTV